MATLAKRMARVTPSAIMELIKTTAGGDYISFASGLPDPNLYPVDTLRSITDDVLARDGKAALQYGAAEGYAPLREWVAAMLRERGLAGGPEHVLITHGSQQSLDLAARALLDPGDGVVIESPTYLAALQIFDSYEADYRTISMDEHGLLPEALSKVLESRPKLVYVLPNFQNPTGITLSAARRTLVAEAVAHAGAALLEDDAYHDLRLEGESLPPVAAGAENPWGVYTGTFSKTVAPGLRVGYLWGQPALVERLAQLKQVTDLHSSSLAQRVVYEYCVRGHLQPGIECLRSAYRERRDALLAALSHHFEGRLRWTRPEGGMFVWVTLPSGCDTSELLQAAMRQGVVFVPGASFHADGSGRNTLRLNFVSATPDRIREGVALLARALEPWLG